MIYIDMDILTDKIQFSIFRYFSNTKKVIRRDEIVLPRCYNTAQKLNYVRNLVSIFIEEDNIKYYKIHIGDLENNEDVKKILDELFQDGEEKKVTITKFNSYNKCLKTLTKLLK